MITRTITTVNSFRQTLVNGFVHKAWLVEFQGSDGYDRAHGFPQSALAWRSAEYGIPYTDPDTLLNIVLYEHLFKVLRHDPLHLYNTGQAQSRANQLSLLSTFQSQVAYSDPNNLLTQVKQAHLASYDARAHADRVSLVNELRSRGIKAFQSSQG